MPDPRTENTSANLLDPDHIEVVREEIDVTKREVVTGEVTIDKRVTLEDVQLQLERVDNTLDIFRREVNETFETRPAAVRTDGDDTIYTVVREVPVVVTHFEVLEEIVVRKVRTVTPEPTVIPVHREIVEVKRTPTATTPTIQNPKS